MRTLQEKILLYGAAALTTQELLSIVVDNIELGQRIAQNNELSELVRHDLSRLRMVEGMGLSRATKIAASAELGRRLEQSKSGDIEQILSDNDAVRVLRPLFANIHHEECWAIFLTSSSKILDKMKVSQGGLQATVIDHKLIVKRALELLAARIILAHNHPSGTAEPSREDREMTSRLCEATELFDITLLDHIIITQDDFYSFKAHGLLD